MFRYKKLYQKLNQISWANGEAAVVRAGLDKQQLHVKLFRLIFKL